MYGRLPWSGKSPHDLLANINNAQIPFNLEPKVTGIAKDFIRGCLQIEEAKRFGWEEIYSHVIFNGKFDNLPFKRGAKAEYVMSDLRQKVHTNNIDLERLFKKQ
jgi:serine/threonine protein kinase